MEFLRRRITGLVLACLSVCTVNTACTQTVAVDIPCDEQCFQPRFVAFGTNEDDAATGIVVTDDEVVVGGIISGKLQYDPPNGQTDMALFSFSKQGDFQRSVQFGTDQTDYLHALLLTGNEGVVAVGWSESPDGGTRWQQPHDAQPFVSRFDNELDLSDTISFGTKVNDYASSAVARSSGVLLIGGFTYGDFDRSNASSTTTNLFLASVKGSTVSLITQWGTEKNDWLNDSVISGDSLIVVGTTEGEFSHNHSSGATDIFISRISDSGHVDSTVQLGTAGNDGAMAVATDEEGTVYLSGLTYGSFSDDRLFAENHAFVMAVSDDGKPLWQKIISEKAASIAYDVTVDGGVVYIVGTVAGSLFEEPYGGEVDMFVAGFDAKTGRRLFYKQYGGTGKDALFAVSINRGMLYAVGWSEGIPSVNLVTHGSDMVLFGVGTAVLLSNCPR